MRCTPPFFIAAIAILALTPVCADEAGFPPGSATEPTHGCLDQKERRAESEAGKVVPLSTAMHVAKRRMPGTIVRARICHGRDGLVYVLTVLAQDGKVARLTVDAVKGTLVGGL